MGSREVDLQRSQFQGGDGLKRFLMITLMAITAVAVVAAPVWAAGGRKLSDRQLDNVHAGSSDPVSDAHSADANAFADSAGDLFIAGAATSASSTLAFATPRVEIKNRCAAGFCKLQVETEAENGGTVTTNAQSILNTVASVNAVQINVAASGSTLQSNTAYSTK